jgi:hypothetical protein
VNHDKLIEYTQSLSVQSQMVRPGSPGSFIFFSPERNKELIAKWIKDVPLKSFTPDASQDILAAIKDMDTLNLKDQDKLQWIMASEELNEWLARDTSCLLTLETETSPDEPVNAITSIAALLGELLGTVEVFAVLSFFWMSRPSRFCQDLTPDMVMLNSINGQLLENIRDRGVEVDLSFLAEDKTYRKSQEKRKQGLALFEHLLGILPEKSAVFILLDLFSCIPERRADVEKMLDRIIKMQALYPKLVMKVLITDLLPTSSLNNSANISLYVPDHVDGERNGVSTELLKEDMRKRVSTGREDADKSSDEESDDEDW